MPARAPDPVLGRRIRHLRVERGLTLNALSAEVGLSSSQLSLIENGHREPRLATLQTLARLFNVGIADLMAEEPPSPRAALELELHRAQQRSPYRTLGLPNVRASRRLPDDALNALVGLHRELQRRDAEAIATPEEARRANTELRLRQREQNNYLPDLEALATEQVRRTGHRQGALTHREVSIMAERLGFQLIYANDLPASTRSITDIRHGRIYLPPASIPGGHGLRSMALQAMAHRILDHRPPASYDEFLTQRLHINYFAAACLMPLEPSVAFLQTAKREKRLAIEDFRDAFGVTHEAAALRFTNLATEHLEMHTHFLRVNGDGVLFKVYENDGLPLPTDVTGSVEGQWVCKQWRARRAFTETNRTTENYQYTDTPTGTFWCATQTGHTDAAEFSITLGVPFPQAKWFRGRETTVRATSRCPDASCCRRPSDALAGRWAGQAWPSARLHAHVLAPLPSGTFPGVDDAEVFTFLDRHAPTA